MGQMTTHKCEVKNRQTWIYQNIRASLTKHYVYRSYAISQVLLQGGGGGGAHWIFLECIASRTMIRRYTYIH